SLPLSETTHFKRIVTSGKGCSTIDISTVHVTPLSYAGNFADAGQEICPGEIAETVSVENYTGEIIDWLESASPTGPWEPLDITPHTDVEFEPESINTSTYLRVIIKTAYCDPDTSDV